MTRKTTSRWVGESQIPKTLFCTSRVDPPPPPRKLNPWPLDRVLSTLISLQMARSWTHQTLSLHLDSLSWAGALGLMAATRRLWSSNISWSRVISCSSLAPVKLNTRWRHAGSSRSRGVRTGNLPHRVQ